MSEHTIEIKDGIADVSISSEDAKALTEMATDDFRYPAQQIAALIHKAVTPPIPRANATGKPDGRRGPRTSTT